MSKKIPYCSLHTHSDASLLDAIQTPEEIVKKAVLYGHPAVAITNHGNIYDSVEFYEEAKKAGIKPVLGCLLKGQEILTSYGIKQIENIKQGDFVLTHRGRFRKVLRTYKRMYDGDIYKIRLVGDNKRRLALTGEHPVLIKD